MEGLTLDTNKPLRIVFLGTPDFAVTPLKAIIDAGFNVVGVVTAPDKPAGRGMKLQQSAVKQFALTQGLKILQPEKLKKPEFIEELKSLEADLQVVIAFRMLPEQIWNMPRLGTINLHASLLPDYRGAAPINWAIINGEKTTGITTFRLKHEIDTGDILMQAQTEISADMTAGELHDVLMHLGADVMVKTLQGIQNNNISPIPQTSNSQKIAPKLFTETCKIDWSKSGEEIKNLIHGLSPFPGAFTHVNGKQLKIYRCRFVHELNDKVHGTVETNHSKLPYIRFAVKDGWIYADELQLEGKKRMEIKELLNGWRV